MLTAMRSSMCKLSCSCCRLQVEQNLLRHTESFAATACSELQDGGTQLLAHVPNCRNLQADFLGQVMTIKEQSVWLLMFLQLKALVQAHTKYSDTPVTDVAVAKRKLHAAASDLAQEYTALQSQITEAWPSCLAPLQLRELLTSFHGQ